MSKRLLSLVTFFFVLVLTACSTTKVTEQWKDPAFEGKFNDVLVLSLNANDSKRRLFETGFLAELDKQRVESSASYEVLPNHADLEKEKIKAAIAGTSIDAVLVMRQVRVKKEDRYVPPRLDYVGDPYYGSFYGYYGYFAPIYTPGYVTEDTIVHLEANLYAVDGEKLVWSGKTETFNPKDANTYVGEAAKTIVGQLTKAGLI